MIREWRVAGFNYAKRCFYFGGGGGGLFYFIINGIMSAEMICGLRNFKVKLFNESLYSHTNNRFFKNPKHVVLIIEIRKIVKRNL